MKSRTLRDIARLLNFKMQEYIGKTYTAANAFFMNKIRLIQMFFIIIYLSKKGIRCSRVFTECMSLGIYGKIVLYSFFRYTCLDEIIYTQIL